MMSMVAAEPETHGLLFQVLKGVGFTAGAAILVVTLVGYAETLTRYALKVLTFFNKSFRPAYEARQVSQHATDFLNRHVFGRIADTAPIHLKVEFVDGPHSAGLLEKGAMFVRIRDERDSTRNTLNALAAIIPKRLYPHARAILPQLLVKAVDLEFLRSCAESMGPHGKQVLAAEFLNPAQQAEPELTTKCRMMYEIRQGGLFEPVLYQELTFLDEKCALEPPSEAVGDEAWRFVEWLRRRATRQAHDETVPLEFLEKTFRVAFVTTAKSATQRELGTKPYEAAMRRDLSRGAESIYILGVREDQHRFAEEVARRCLETRRVEQKKAGTANVTKDQTRFSVPIILLVPNRLYSSPELFRARVAEMNLAPGTVVSGLLTTSTNSAMRVDVDHLEGLVSPSEVAWGFDGDAQILGASYGESAFRVRDVNHGLGTLELSWKRTRKDPWASKLAPIDGETRLVDLVAIIEQGILVRMAGVSLELCDDIEAPDTDDAPTESADPEAESVPVVSAPDGIFGLIPHEEWDWAAPGDTSYVAPQIGTSVQARVLKAHRGTDRISLSRREAAGDPAAWQRARKRYLPDTEHRGRVTAVDRDGITVELEPGIFGRVAAYKLRKRGFEFADFEKNVVVGAGYQVVVERGRDLRQSFVLDLARERTTATEPDKSSPSGPRKRQRK